MPRLELPHNATDVDLIHNRIKALAGLNADDYNKVKSDKGHTFNLEDHISQIRGLIRCFEGIEKVDLELYPKNKLTSNNEPLQRIILDTEQFFNELKDPGFTQSHLDAIEQKLKGIHERAHSKMGSIKAHSTSPDDSRMQDRAIYAGKLLKDMEKKNNNAGVILQKLQDESNKQGVSKEARPFKDEAERFDRSQTKWYWFLVASILLIIVGGLVSVLVFEIPTGDVSSTLSHVLARLSVLGALWYAALFCSRNYRAAAHGKIINNRCANALDSFEQFVAGTSDTAVKNAVLQRATETIFSHQTTGFGQREKVEPPLIFSQLVGGFAGKDN